MIPVATRPPTLVVTSASLASIASRWLTLDMAPRRWLARVLPKGPAPVIFATYSTGCAFGVNFRITTCDRVHGESSLVSRHNVHSVTDQGASR
jgi:hypothetical protein